MSSEQKRPVHVFYSYAQRDRTLRDRLEEHLSNLKYRGLIQTWHDRNISAGDEWAEQIDIHLDTADIVLLLISSSFMASDYCYSIEMKRALERYEKREAHVIPILLRPVMYTDAPFAKLQPLPTNKKPVVDWNNRDRAFVDIALGIERVVQGYPFSNRSGLGDDSLVGISQPVSLEYQAGSDYISQYRGLSCRSLLFGIGVGLLVIVGLLAAGILSVQHRQLIPYIAEIVGGLLLVIGLIFAVRFLTKRVQEERVRRAREKARLLEEQERETLRRQQEALRRQQEEEQRLYLSRERAYYHQALEAYEKALLRDPTDVTALKGKGNAFVGLKRYDEALEAFNQTIAWDPTPNAYVNVGNVLFELHRYEEALEAYEKALQLDLTFAFAYAGKAIVLKRIKRYEEAYQARGKARQLGYEDFSLS